MKFDGPRRRLFVVLACVCITAFAPQDTFTQGATPPGAPAPCVPNAQGSSRLKIMPLGDSITFGTPDPSRGGYRRLLGTLLTKDGYSFEFVGSQRSGDGVIPSPSNEGHPGWTILQIKNGIDSRGWLDTYQPDIILLHIGTNDLRTGVAAAAPSSLSALLDDILGKLPGAQIIVAQIIPFRVGSTKGHQAYTQAIPGIARSKGPRVSTIDMRTILSKGDYADIFHPNAGGYDKMARAWERAVRPVMSGCAQRGEAPAQPSTPAAGAVPPGRNSARQPRGIYGAILPWDHRPYTATIENPAISGLFLYFDWATLEPNKDQFDFSAVEAALAIADSKRKTVQFAVLPGFSTPRWLLDELPSCDGWLASGRAAGPSSPECGKATFGLPEGPALRGQMHELPLPWNPAYKKYWHAFLVEFARKFGQREAFVSIAVAGPTSQSEEIIMPHNGPGETEKWARLLDAFYRDPSYHRSNKAFVEEWRTAIDDYGRIFGNVTLALTLASGFPFNPTRPGGQEASTLEIAAYFAKTPLGTNAKATQNNGITAAHPLTMRPVKAMASDTKLNPRILAGGEFATGFSRNPAREGCPSDDSSSPACKNVTPERAFDNVLSVFFAGTPYGHFYGSPDGPAPIHYLQIYQDDILYANGHPPVQEKLLEASKRILSSR